MMVRYSAGVMRYLGIALIIANMVLNSGCSDSQESIPTYTVSAKPFALSIQVNGQLEAANATVISASSQQPMTIAWLEKEYSMVKEGQVIARFDAEQLNLDMRREMLAMMVLEEDIKLSQNKLNQESSSVLKDKALVMKEYAFADQFNIDDLRVYSKLEIIENLQNKEYLGAKDNYLDWKKDSVVEQNSSAIDVLSIRKQGNQHKYEQIQSAITSLDVVAPYDGLLVYETNWRGEKPTVGSTIFPGAPLAKLPDLSHMQAKGFVLDKEAIDLTPGLPVEIVLDAYPNQTFTGSLQDVAGFSRTISRANPTKYFEVTLTIDDQQSPLLTPGRKLTATIKGADETPRLLVPIQAIYNQNGTNFVFVKNKDDFARRQVDIGKKNLYFVEITRGLSEGEDIALSYEELI